MTANRLGLHNVEEVYLSTLLTKTIRWLEAGGDSIWQSLRRKFAEREKTNQQPHRLPKLVKSALGRLQRSRDGRES